MVSPRGVDTRPLVRAVATVVASAALAIGGSGILRFVHGWIPGFSAPQEALLYSITVAGVLVPALLFALVFRLGDRSNRRRGVVGVIFTIAAIGFLWALVPAGWSGDPSTGLIPVLAVYSVGFAWLLLAFVDARKSSGRQEVTFVRSGRPDSVPVQSDGGSRDDDLRFVLDEDDSR